MSELNDIRHLSFPLTLNARGSKLTTSLHSTTKCHGADTSVSTDADCAVFASVPHSIVNRETSDNITDNSVPSQGEATAVNMPTVPPDAAVAINSSIPDIARRA